MLLSYSCPEANNIKVGSCTVLGSGVTTNVVSDLKILRDKILILDHTKKKKKERKLNTPPNITS